MEIYAVFRREHKYYNEQDFFADMTPVPFPVKIDFDENPNYPVRYTSYGYSLYDVDLMIRKVKGDTVYWERIPIHESPMTP
jgi:hypothetical protein